MFGDVSGPVPNSDDRILIQMGKRCPKGIARLGAVMPDFQVNPLDATFVAIVANIDLAELDAIARCSSFPVKT